MGSENYMFSTENWKAVLISGLQLLSPPVMMISARLRLVSAQSNDTEINITLKLVENAAYL